MDQFEVVVSKVEALTPRIREFVLARANGAPMPGWAAGAHIDVHLPDVGRRSYSLIETSSPRATEHPTSYRIGVLQESKSKGGSTYMHGLKAGDRLTISPPANNFPLHAGAGEIVLVAGGIGITPLLTMACELGAAQRPFSFHYAGRSRSELAFLGEVERLTGAKAVIHADDEAGRFFDLEGLMTRLAADVPLYLCGPLPMIEAAIALAKRLDWPPGRLHFEIFSAPEEKSGDSSFEVELKSSGRVYAIPPGKTILDVLIEAGEDPMHDCKRGDCGICQTAVLEGIPDHRDYILSDSEKASNKVMQICVSRAKTEKLVLDL
ncbi:PDR/VanB family oxidoreductase [Bradyrhizobium ivorense]|uniref:PDR/VanB family oxidoreductase n=1 Tax=Bradyrhizobium ivorense TaxID=2511166 RepID=UPI0010B31418|nr:PDR/VanB family oxidoreductase [Bradyrhizobium ivorense]VIO77739.1 Phenoxybenzoate dioxygenase subunit beta [Bradyrhizobium ivorense]